MQEVRIADLKSRLSEYLDAVRRGESIDVLNRDTLVARIVPVRERASLRIRRPAPGTPPPNRVPLPKPLAPSGAQRSQMRNIDAVDLLLEERQGQR